MTNWENMTHEDEQRILDNMRNLEADPRDPDQIIRDLQDRIEELEPSLRDWKDMAMKYREALVWALGGGDDFPPEVGGRPFWWRIELQKRAGLIWNGKRFEDA